MNSDRKKSSRPEHMIDARFTIPVFFSRYYFLVLVGKDKRRSKVAIADERRRQSRLLKSIFYLSIMMWAVISTLALTLIVIYVLKAFMGVDVFPDSHPLRLLLQKMLLC